MKYWVSWYQPTEDYRPIYSKEKPLSKNILGWWNSGSRCSDDANTIVAWLEAKNEDDGKKIIKSHWPEANEWRFFDEVEDDWKPSDRFPSEGLTND